jgi:hypothetical protein
MVGTLGAVLEAYDAVDINPAGIGLGSESNISFSQGLWAQGPFEEHLVFAQREGSQDGFSMGGDYINFSNLTLFSTAGSYSPMGLDFYGGYGVGVIGGLRAGLTAHLIYDNINLLTPGQTIALDGGLLYRVQGMPLVFSAVVSDLGWELDNSPLPTTLRTACTYRIDWGSSRKHPGSGSLLILAAQGDWDLTSDYNSTVGVAEEFWYERFLALRAGYRFSTNAGVIEGTGFSLGTGVRFGDWRVDYALNTTGDLGTSNQISVGMLFGETKPIPKRRERVVPAPTSLGMPAPAPPPRMIPPPAITPTSVRVVPALSPVLATRKVVPPPVEKMGMLQFYKKGMTLYAQERYPLAAIYFRRAAMAPGGAAWQRAEVYSMLGLITQFHSEGRGHLEVALESYRKALRLDSGNETARKYMAKLKKAMRHN